MSTTNYYQNELATTVQILMNGQITLPISIRRALKLQRGSFLDIQLRDKEIVLVPKTLVDKTENKQNTSSKTEKAREHFFSVIDQIRERNRDIDQYKIEADINKAIIAVRKNEKFKTLKQKQK